MGTDLTVVNAARVSFDKLSTELSEGDKKLIAYLAKHIHWSPFSHPHASFRIKAPIFVARQLVKHQVGLAWNEVSRRYVDSEPEFYTPRSWRGRASDKKQGSSTEEIKGIDSIVLRVLDHALETYNRMLKDGVAPELARAVLPTATMTEWIWTGSLYAWARVCNLRLEEHAQAETREVAQSISNEMKVLFPVSWPVLVPAS
jgi:thymidylate synthase (FAD)